MNKVIHKNKVCMYYNNNRAITINTIMKKFAVYSMLRDTLNYCIVINVCNYKSPI